MLEQATGVNVNNACAGVLKADRTDGVVLARHCKPPGNSVIRQSTMACISRNQMHNAPKTHTKYENWHFRVILSRKP
jgi:hypothetical protein